MALHPVLASTGAAKRLYKPEICGGRGVARERPGQEDQRAAAGRGRVLVVPSETVPMEGSGRNDMAQEHVIEGFLCIVAFVF